jgi:hypothetical protein
MSATTLPCRRLPDWQPRLARLMAQRGAALFVWGGNDCCLFAADAVLAVTGHDPAADLRGTYASALQAARVLRQAGGVAGVAAARAGAEVLVAMAQPGDVGLCVQDPSNPALAVFGGAAWHAPGAHGLATHMASSIARAWRCTATPAAESQQHA